MTNFSSKACTNFKLFRLKLSTAKMLTLFNEEMQRQKELLFKHFVKWKQAQDTTGQDVIYEQIISIHVEIIRLELELDKSQAGQHAEGKDKSQGYEDADQEESDYNPVEDTDDEMDEGESDS